MTTPREQAKTALQHWYETETPQALEALINTLEPLIETELRALKQEVVTELIGESPICPHTIATGPGHDPSGNEYCGPECTHGNCDLTP